MTDSVLLSHITHEKPENKNWLLLIHGAGGSTRTWKKQIDDLGQKYNLLVIDLPGHGTNNHQAHLIPQYSFTLVANKVWEVVDHLKIDKLHAMGVSLGSIICLQMSHLQPSRFLSIILPGAIVKLNSKLKILSNLSLKSVKLIGYRNFYNLSARIILPRKNHSKSRSIFVRESKALKISEFKKWTQLYYDLNGVLKELFLSNSATPKLLIMGGQDHLFLKPAREYVGANVNTDLEIVQGCGHLVSLEKAKEFNQICLAFLKNVAHKA